MTRANRVTPVGELIAVPDRGLFWGNRGCLVNDAREVTRYSAGRMWIICVLSFKGRRRVQWQPRRLTEVYFLDEATGMAAGHRPCGECRNLDYRRFKAAFFATYPEDEPGVRGIDARMHADRLVARGVRRTYPDDSGALPTGTMVLREDAGWLIRGDRLLRWTPGGYDTVEPYRAGQALTVLTPRCTVAVLAEGYRPVLHPTAESI
ncbi:MAG TPA: hypothetical protein VE081_10300 [Sporichthyaceae bacterium]|nr:hypothetical protein [Sporichthyaceae bacterium]